MGNLGIFGELEIKAVDRNGNYFIFHTPNTLTFDAKRTVAHAIVGDDLNNLKVTKLAVGTGTNPPARSNISLQTQIAVAQVDTIIYPAPGQIELITFLDFVTSANGHTLTEAGLFSEDGNHMFARQVYAGVPKDENFKLEYRWRLVFT